jgi:hypothetical protein
MNFLKTLTLLVLTATCLNAEVLSVNFDKSTPRAGFDPVYSDGQSSIFVGTVSGDTGIRVSMRGSDYLQSPKDNKIWGLLDNSLPGNEERPGWLIRAGWQPDAVGARSFSHPYGQTPAGYIEVCYERPEGMVFQDISLSIEDPQNLELLNVWAATSNDNYQTLAPVTVTKNSQEEFLNLNLNGINYIGADPLKIRIYGLIGEDDGTFNINGTINVLSPPVVVPEPSGLLLLGIPFFLSLRRKRQSQR